MQAPQDRLVELLDAVGRSSFEQGRASARSRMADGPRAAVGETTTGRPAGGGRREAEEQLRLYVDARMGGRQVPDDVLTAVRKYGDVMEGAGSGRVHDPTVPWDAGSVANIPAVTVARVHAVVALEAAIGVPSDGSRVGQLSRGDRGRSAADRRERGVPHRDRDGPQKDLNDLGRIGGPGGK